MTDESRPEPKVFRRGEMVPIPRMPEEPKRELDPEILATIERARRKRIQEYLDNRRKRAS